MPQRIQRRRIKGWRMPEGAVYVGRPTVWGNPYVIVRSGKTTWDVCGPYSTHSTLATFISRTGVEARTDAVRRLRRLVAESRDPWGTDRVRAELAGRDLVCWCPLEDAHGNRVPCHADVLLEIANRGGAS